MDDKKADLNDGYTRIANKIIDVLCQCSIFNREARVLLFILRQTYGYNHKERALSLTYISKSTGIDRSNVCRIVQKLVDAKIVKKSFKKENNCQMLGLNTKVCDWLGVVKYDSVKYDNRGVVKNDTGGVVKFDTHINTEYINTECVGENGVCRFPVTQIFDRLWSEWSFSQAGKDRVPRKVRLEIESIGYMKMNDARLRYEDELENRRTKNNQALSARTWFNGAYRPYLPKVAENETWTNIKGEVYYKEVLLE